MGADRAVGVRLAYGSVPAAVRDWVEVSLGSAVVHAQACTGGMSPGCATRLQLADGRRAFVKAVGAELNERSYELYRTEIALLTTLPAAVYRPSVLGCYDHDGWAGLLLDDLPGGELDLSRATDFADAAAVVDRLTRELTPAPSGIDVESLDDTARTWLQCWPDIAAAPQRYLPAWAVEQFGILDVLVRSVPDRLAGSTLCHWDIRADNLLRTVDGHVVVCDWGMARRGVWWADRFQLLTRHAAHPWVDDWLDDQPGWSAVLDGDLTALLVLFGARHAWLAEQPPDPGLPTIAAFRRARAADMLSGARRRLARS